MQAQPLHQGGQDQLGILDGRKVNEADAMREVPLDLGCDGKSQTRLAHPSGAGQGEQPHLRTRE